MALRGAEKALSNRPRLARGLVVGTALCLNLLLFVLLLSAFDPPVRRPRAASPVDLVFVRPDPPAPAAEPAPAEPEPTEIDTPATAPPDASAPSRDLPQVALPEGSAGPSGAVALDCYAAFEAERDRAEACAGGEEVPGWAAALGTNWERAAGDVAPGDASFDSLAIPAERRAAFDADIAAKRARQAGPASPIASSGAGSAPSAGGDAYLATPSLLTSHGDRRAATEERERRDDAQRRRALGEASEPR